ncbi:MAG: SRPBCC family protein [Actinomycetota bacterium]
MSDAEKSVVIREGTFTSPPARLWSFVADFGGLDKIMPTIDASEVDGEGVGAVRRLTMGDAVIVESLDAFDDSARSLTYSIQEAPLPFADYSATMKVDADGDGSKLTWTGTFRPDGVPAAKAKKLAGGIYEGGIAGFKAALGE